MKNSTLPLCLSTLASLLIGLGVGTQSLRAAPVSPQDISGQGSGVAVIVNSPVLQDRVKSGKVFLDFHPCSMKKIVKSKNSYKKCFVSAKRLQVPANLGAVKSRYSTPPVYSMPAGDYILKQVWWLDPKNDKRLGVNMNWQVSLAKNSVQKLGIISLVGTKNSRVKAVVLPFKRGLVKNSHNWPKVYQSAVPARLAGLQVPRGKLKRKYVDAYQEDLNSFDADAWDRSEIVEYHSSEKASYRSNTGVAPSPPHFDIVSRVVKKTPGRPARYVSPPPPTSKTVNYQIGVRYNVAIPRNSEYVNPLLSSLGGQTGSLQQCYESNIKRTSGIVRGTKWSNYLYQFRAGPGGGASLTSSGRSRPNKSLDQCIQRVLKSAHRRNPPSKLTSGVMQVRFDYSGQ